MSRFGWAAAVCGAVILGIAFFLQSTAYSALAAQVMTTGGIILLLGVALLAFGVVIRR